MRLWPILIGVLAVSTMLLGGCMGDLPEPTRCPPDEKIEASSCLTPSLSNEPEKICFTEQPKAFECLTGPRPQGCACSDARQECPADENSCYPPGDCPRIVTDRVGANATCMRLGPSAFDAACVCGCAECLAVCDGRGPVFGSVILPNMPPFAMLGIELADQMPASGKFGVYVRYRGVPNDSVVVSTRAQSGSLQVAAQYMLTAPANGLFSEELLYESSSYPIPPTPYAWQSGEAPPRHIDLVANATGPLPEAKSLIEIDCLIPFVAP